MVLVGSVSSQVLEAPAALPPCNQQGALYSTPESQPDRSIQNQTCRLVPWLVLFRF